MSARREILVRLDTTGATDTHCWGEDVGVMCRSGMTGRCPWPHGGKVRSAECIAAENAAKGEAVEAPKRLRDCRGFVETINELCTCGGSKNFHGCDACKIYHAIGDWLTVEASTKAQETESEPVEKCCGTCGNWDAFEDEKPMGNCNIPRPFWLEQSDLSVVPSNAGSDCECWKLRAR